MQLHIYVHRVSPLACGWYIHNKSRKKKLLSFLHPLNQKVHYSELLILALNIALAGVQSHEKKKKDATQRYFTVIMEGASS